MRTFYPIALAIGAILFSTTTHAQTFDIQPMDAGPVQYLVPGTYPVMLTISNNTEMGGICEDFWMYWQLDNGVIQECDYTTEQFQGLYPSSLRLYEHCIPITFSEPGNHTMKLWTSQPGDNPDQNSLNDTIYSSIQVVDYLPPRNVTVFIGTHTQCFPCGGVGEENMYDILEAYPANAYIISAHDDEGGDPYECLEGTAFNDVYVWPHTGHPAFIRDLFRFPDFPSITYGNDQVEHTDRRMTYMPPVEITIDNIAYDDANDILTGDITAHFYADYSGQLAMNAVLTEDSIWGYQFGAPGQYIYHRHVMRDMSAWIYGSIEDIPAEIDDGDVITYPFELPISTDFVFENMYVTGYIQKTNEDADFHEILNSFRIRISDFVENTNAIANITANTIELFPNPASGEISISGMDQAVNEITILDMSGRIIKSLGKPALQNGLLKLDVSVLADGEYILQLHCADITINESLVIRK